MSATRLRSVLLFSFFLLLAFQACRKGDRLPSLPPDRSFVEEFDTTASAFARGWAVANRSDPKGPGAWVQGLLNDPGVTGFPTIPFSAYSSKGIYPGFIGVDFTSTSAAAGTISNWLISPAIDMENGDRIIFYTRSVLLALPPPSSDSTDYANRLQVRINSKNDGLNVGNGLEVGDFTSTLLDINSEYLEASSTIALIEPQAYPFSWTRFEATVSGLTARTKGRFAFRYFTELAGSNGRGTGIAIDSVAYVAKKP